MTNQQFLSLYKVLWMKLKQKLSIIVTELTVQEKWEIHVYNGEIDSFVVS